MAKRRQTVISVITVISILGVAAGVAALIIALAINNGFRSTLQATLLGATAHVTLLERNPSSGIGEWRPLVSKVARVRGVISAQPALYGSVFFSGPAQASGGFLKGIPQATVELRGYVKQGSLDAIWEKSDVPAILLGSKLAQSTGMVPGSRLTVISPQGELTPFGPVPSYFTFRVAGTFETGFYDLDSSWAFASLESVQRVLDAGDVVTAIELRISDIERAPEVARVAEAAAGETLAASTWMEQNRPLLNALNTERSVTTLTIGLIELVAALNILIVLVMMVMEKTRDIALLAAMGARVEQIRRIFIIEGGLIGFTGTVIGLAVGYTVCYLAGRFRWIPLDEQVYSLSFLPFEARWTDGVWVAAVAIGVSLLATLYPAWNAARVRPAETLRYE